MNGSIHCVVKRWLFNRYSLPWRKFNNSCCKLKKIPADLKDRSRSSQDWLIRQLNDKYVKLAKYHNYRARSAFKLIEIDDKFEILQPGFVVLECGAAPGAWTQVAVQRTNATGKDSSKPKGRVIAVDLQSMEKIEGAEILPPMDLRKVETHNNVLSYIKTLKANTVLSDMSPKVSGMHQLDHEKSVELFYAAVKLSLLILCTEGNFLGKLLVGGSEKKIENDLLKFFNSVKIVKPPASRKDSTEIYILALKFKGIEIYSKSA